MKKLYIVGGTMGVGKTAVCKALTEKLPNSVFLDGDWCWNSNPVCINNETKKMVLENICFLLNQYLKCSAYENIVFCWVLHEQSVIDAVLSRIDAKSCETKVLSLVCSKKSLLERLEKDIQNGIRTRDVVERSIERIPLYEKLDTIKIVTDGKSAEEIAENICRL